MARLYSCGFETGHQQGEDLTLTGALVAVFDTGTVRSGSRSLRCHPTAATAYVNRTISADTAGLHWYLRVYVYIATAPSATVSFFQTRDSTTAYVGLRMTSGGVLQLFDEAQGVQIGSNSSALSTGQWYRLEFEYNAGTGACSARIDGTQFASGTTATTAMGQVRLGFTTSGTGDLYFDDWAVNDASGAAQTSWPGDGKIVYLRPVSDPGTSSANWVKPGGATTNRHTSVDNIPPVYEALDNTGTSAEDYLTNAVSGAGAALELDTGTYTAAGIGASDTITLVRPICGTGSSSATDTAGKLGAASNPAITVLAFTAFDNGIASTVVTTWPRQEGTYTYAPTVTLGSGCRLRVEKTTATTRVAIVNMLALLVEYVPAAGGGTPAVTPAAITSSSDVTAAVVRQRPVTPASLSATSAVTAAVSRARPVAPSAITSTSDVTASVRRGRPVTPSSLTATSTVTASVVRLRPVTPAALTATSNVTASVVRLRPVAPGAVTATSAVSATVSRHGTGGVVPAGIVASSNVTAAVVRTRALAIASVSATSSVTASLAARRPVGPSAITATSTVTASVSGGGAVQTDLRERALSGVGL